ncbi:HDOD domain-containing protein [Marinobacter bohaiensis]|uniref:HDOD domain-containing protein n=1 Tax=Marinobacter bohaiensis TaxID=2201898 RepID=UPI000DABD135|nr:HDOD domain-containing protein [Marinobacter bohaiensis]
MWRLFNWLKPKIPASVPETAPPLDTKPDAPDGPDPDNQPSHSALDQLENHLFCWLLDAGPATIERDTPMTPVVLTALADQLRSGALNELPRQPNVLPMLLRALTHEDVSRKELAEIILADPALTDQLLHMSNSPFFRPGEHLIETVEQAIFRLGLDGVRSVAAAAVMRPMMTARNSHEALFAQRVWRWGLACARSAELIANARGDDGNAFFLVGLIPAMAHLTLYREVVRLYRERQDGAAPEPAVIHAALRANDWTVTRLLAVAWNLPPRYQAHLLSTERPVRGRTHTPLNDGMILGTREVLRDAHQRNLPEDVLVEALALAPDEFERIRALLLNMLRDAQRT